MLYNPDDRRGNDLPPVVDQDSRISTDREDMLYSYQNTVASSYVGDVRHIVSKLGDYLQTKNKYYDVKKQEFIEFPIRYAAPNLVFSDDKGNNGAASEASIKDRIVLPVISYYLKGMEHDPKRAIDPCVRYAYKPDKNNPGKVLVTTAPKMMKYSFQVDLWVENRETFYQLVSAFQLDFNPYSYLYDLYAYEDETQKSFYFPYVKMSLTSFSDASNFVPGTDRRVVRGTFAIDVDGFLSQPPTQMNYVFNTNIGMDGEYSSGIGRITASTWSGSGLVSSNSSGDLPSVLGQAGKVLSTDGKNLVWETLPETPTNLSFTQLIGDGINTDYLILHNLNTDSVFLEIWETGGLKRKVASTVTVLDSNKLSLHFSKPPAVGSLKVIAISSEFSTAEEKEGASDNTFVIRLSQPMSYGSLFRIINNQAYPVRSIDSIVPFVDGILLAGGNAGDSVLAGSELNTVYDTSEVWDDDYLLYLSQTGTLTKTIPDFANGDKYGLIVGRSLKGTKSFILDPKTPIKLG